MLVSLISLFLSINENNDQFVLSAMFIAAFSRMFFKRTPSLLLTFTLLALFSGYQWEYFQKNQLLPPFFWGLSAIIWFVLDDTLQHGVNADRMRKQLLPRLLLAVIVVHVVVALYRIFYLRELDALAALMGPTSGIFVLSLAVYLIKRLGDKDLFYYGLFVMGFAVHIYALSIDFFSAQLVTFLFFIYVYTLVNDRGLALLLNAFLIVLIGLFLIFERQYVFQDISVYLILLILMSVGFALYLVSLEKLEENQHVNKSVTSKDIFTSPWFLTYLLAMMLPLIVVSFNMLNEQHKAINNDQKSLYQNQQQYVKDRWVGEAVSTYNRFLFASKELDRQLANGVAINDLDQKRIMQRDGDQFAVIDQNDVKALLDNGPYEQDIIASSEYQQLLLWIDTKLSTLYMLKGLKAQDQKAWYVVNNVRLDRFFRNELSDKHTATVVLSSGERLYEISSPLPNQNLSFIELNLPLADVFTNNVILSHDYMVLHIGVPQSSLIDVARSNPLFEFYAVVVLLILICLSFLMAKQRLILVKEQALHAEIDSAISQQNMFKTLRSQMQQSKFLVAQKADAENRSKLFSIVNILENILQSNDLRKSWQDQKSQLDSLLHIIHYTIENMLSYTNLDRKQLQMIPKASTIRELVDELYDMYQPLMAQKKLSFEFFKSGLIDQTVYVDSDLLKKALQNILDNALKYTDRGGVIVDVKTSDSEVMFSIQDTGVGIDQSLCDVNSASNSPIIKDNNEHVAVGLYLTRKYLTALGGTIQLFSSLGKGTKVDITVPLLPSDRVELSEMPQ